MQVWQLQGPFSFTCHWLKSKCQQAPIIFFKPKNKRSTSTYDKWSKNQPMQKTQMFENVKNLSVMTEENLDWNLHLNLLKLKLIKAIGLLCKILYFIPKFLLKTQYYTIFNSYLM